MAFRDGVRGGDEDDADSDSPLVVVVAAAAAALDGGITVHLGLPVDAAAADG